MDITKSSKKIYTTKLINSETVGYVIYNLFAFLLFIITKQVLKIGFNLEANISVAISFVIALIVSYLLEKKFVFNREINNSTTKQIPLLLLRSGIDFGFFVLATFVFSHLLDMTLAFVYGFVFVIFLFFNYQFDKLVVFNSRYQDDGYQSKLYKLVFSNRYLIISGVVAFACFCVFLLFNKAFPFGDNTILRMDLYHQYGPLFTEFYDKIVNHESFIYSWTSGGGTSFLGNYFNYLSSPLSLIIFLFNRDEMSYAVTTMVIVKNILAAIAFTYYLKKSQKSHSFASASFGVLYAFCAYFLAYYWNIMWLDGMIILPFITLGIEKIIDEGKSGLYICSLALLFYCNYYVGFMMCIFAVIYFLCYFFISHNLTEKIDNQIGIYEKNTFKYIANNYFIGRGLNFAFSSIIAALLLAFVLIPVYFILQSCSATSDVMPSSNETYFDILTFLSNHIAALETTIRSSGDDVLPNVYSGMISCLLLPAFIANKNIKMREKCSYIVLLVFFYASFNNNFLNYFWHAMHFPNDLPYRFSFMYSFILLIVAYKALVNIKGLKYKDYALIGMSWIFLIAMFQKFDTNKLGEYSIYASIGFTIILTGLLMCIRAKKLDKLVAGLLLITLTFSEVVVCDLYAFRFNNSKANYTNNYSTYMDATSYLKDFDKDFYRAELWHLDTTMDPCLYNYPGISIFSSMAYESYSGKQYSLGLTGNRINSYTYNPQTPIYNLMYSIKYVIDKGDDGLSKLTYDKIYTTEDGCASIYKNKYHLPIAYTVPSELKDWTISEGNPFEEQSRFIELATGVKDIFVPVNYLGSTNDRINCDNVFSNGTYFFDKTNKNSNDGSINIKISSKEDSNLFVYVHSPKVKYVNYAWGDDEKTETQYIDPPFIYDLGQRNKDEEVNIKINCGEAKEDSSFFEIYAYSVDLDKLEACYELLNLGAIDIKEHNETHISGVINAGYNGSVYTSIPYDSGWSVSVDGDKVETYKLADAQLGFDITEGEHNIEFNYRPKGLLVGSIISISTIICIIAFNIIKKRRNLSKMNKKSNEDEINILS